MGVFDNISNFKDIKSMLLAVAGLGVGLGLTLGVLGLTGMGLEMLGVDVPFIG